jgi:hypothetical protein
MYLRNVPMYPVLYSFPGPSPPSGQRLHVEWDKSLTMPLAESLQVVAHRLGMHVQRLAYGSCRPAVGRSPEANDLRIGAVERGEKLLELLVGHPLVRADGPVCWLRTSGGLIGGEDLVCLVAWSRQLPGDPAFEVLRPDQHPSAALRGGKLLLTHRLGDRGAALMTESHAVIKRQEQLVHLGALQLPPPGHSHPSSEQQKRPTILNHSGSMNVGLY